MGQLIKDYTKNIKLAVSRENWRNARNTRERQDNQIGFLGGASSTPTPAPLPTAPEPEDAEGLAAEQRRNAILRKKLHGKTLLTGPQGDLLTSEETKASTLLGS